MSLNLNNLKDAPPSGSIIKLAPFVNLNIVIEALGEHQKKATRNGERLALPARVHSADATVEGLLYQSSIAGGMKAGDVYAGKLGRDGMAYTLAPLTEDEKTKLAAAITARLNGNGVKQTKK